MASSPSVHSARSEWMVKLIAIVVAVAVLYVAKGVLVPLTLALLLSFALAPLCNWLERRRLGRIPAVLVAAVLVSTLLGSMTWMASVQIISLASKLPEYESSIHARVHSVNSYLSSAMDRARRTTLDISKNLSQSAADGEPQGGDEPSSAVRVISVPESPLQVIGGMSGSLLKVFGTAGIVIVLVVFFLIQRDDLRDRFIRVVGGGRVTLTTQALEDATARVSRYLLVQLFLNVTFGLLVALGLYCIGLPNFLLWGFLAAVLRFIPYIGPWIAAAAPIGLSMVISPGWAVPIMTIGLFVALEILSNNIMEPLLYGRNTGVSAVAILVAAVFWTWVWGPIGLLLATPLTVCLLVIGKHVPELSFWDTLLGNMPVFETKTRVYQRLLAGDMEEAVELIDDSFEHSSLVEVYDTVLIPALALAETQWHRGTLNENRHQFMFQSMKETVEELGQRQQELTLAEGKRDAENMPADSSPVHLADSSSLCILCLPARDEADEIAGLMLAQVLETTGCLVQTVSVRALASEMIDIVEQRKADVVCISAMPPAAGTRARYLCKRLRGRFPDANLIVGLWNVKGDLSKAKERIGCGPTTHVVGTLADAQKKIRSLMQPLLLRPGKEPQPDSGHAVMA